MTVVLLGEAALHHPLHSLPQFDGDEELVPALDQFAVPFGPGAFIAFGISVATVTGVNRTVAPSSEAASWRRQLWIRLRVMLCLSATSDTVAPGAEASARIAFFVSAL